MKTFKILLMATFTIFTISLFAQDTINTKVKTSKHKSEKVKYSCPMHPDVTSKKPGTCSKCGMGLTKSKKEQMKMEVMKMYTCPMHPDITSDKPGKCTKCGMDLKEKTAASYVCPMHPDVTSDKPGKCPKCGMSLVMKKNDAEKKDDK
jgi:predicted RNA-binding Zn-ribbon protein involved in translation (DUF1610 family)